MPIQDSKTLHFNQVFTNYQHRFIRFARTYVHEESAAEDIVMDSFMYYWEKRDSLTPDSNVPAYILTVIKHKCLNHLRAINVHKKVEEKLLIHNYVFVNGHNLGRYWKVGPQKTIYLPGWWLKPGKNQFMIFEQQNNTVYRSVRTINRPILSDQIK